MDNTWAHYRAKVAALSRSRTDDDSEFIEARHNLRLARAEHDIRTILTGTPPLTEQQRRHLATVLLEDGGAA